MFFCEEFIEGESLYLLYYFTKSGEVYRFSQVNYAQQTGGKSILAAGCATLHNDDISKEYENIPTVLRGILDVNELQTQSRYEEERFHYITKYVNIKGKRVLDIGGNSGYFTFESYSAGANFVDYYEGNSVHADFVKEAVELLDLQKRIHVYPEYFMFHSKVKKRYDIIFCLNVVHHLGDDFGEEAEFGVVKRKMLTCINSMAKITDILVFQMGYNWCGNPKMGLFEGGTKQEMEKYLHDGIQNDWEILKTGIAEKRGDKIQYMDKNESNNLREDSLGEFLNRPIFIL